MARQSKRRAVYPGSFDPLTNGHLSLIERGSSLFDELVVAVATAPSKNVLFTAEERLMFMRSTVAKLNNYRRIKVVGFDGLLADFVREIKADAIIRGLRAVSDFEYEFQMALMNRQLWNELETLFLAPDARYTFLSASLVREIASLGGDVSALVSPHVLAALQARFGGRRT